jgi:hypothetical protein
VAATAAVHVHERSTLWAVAALPAGAWSGAPPHPPATSSGVVPAGPSHNSLMPPPLTPGHDSIGSLTGLFALFR